MDANGVPDHKKIKGRAKPGGRRHRLGMTLAKTSTIYRTLRRRKCPFRETDRDLAKFLREQLPDPRALQLPNLRTLRSSGAISTDFDEKIADGVAGLRLSLGLDKDRV
jgi:hypothetical protein